MNIEVIKRNGSLSSFNIDKIRDAVTKAANKINETIDEDSLAKILKDIENYVEEQKSQGMSLFVENIQDKVESSLMVHGLVNIAKEYILYRDIRNNNRKYFNLLYNEITEDWIKNLLNKIWKKYNISYKSVYKRYKSYTKEGIVEIDLLIKSVVESISMEEPHWDTIAGFLYYKNIDRIIKNNVSKYVNSTFVFDLVKYLVEQNLYHSNLINVYTEEDYESIIYDLSFLNLEWNFTYSSIDILYKRYLVRNHEGEVLESPILMFTSIALFLCSNEEDKKDRYDLIKQTAENIALFKYTLATPTFSNARKPRPQLSSCFIDTVPDSLNGIYRSLTEFAKVSKFGGGMGIYMGKVRALGSDIRGFKGVAGGVIRWVKLFNDTAIAVDQLGVRSGSCSITLDIWHKDIPEFLQVRTNNGDDRLKAHDIFPAVSIPDMFWNLAKNDIDAEWHLMCPHEIFKQTGFNLEDYYGEEWEKRYLECVENINISKRTVTVKDIVRLIIKSAVETGTPFIFNRDTVNKANPMKKLGIIYSSNLCTEIAQNMSPAYYYLESNNKNDNRITEETLVGNYVTCNLGSINLSKFAGWEKDPSVRTSLLYTIFNLVNVLDNVISLNMLPTVYADKMNQGYRAIGIGVSGYHHLLALEGIKWESEEHIQYADKLFRLINFASLIASSILAKYKGKCSVSDFSEVLTDEYLKQFKDLDSFTEKSIKLIKEYGIRNAYRLAIAPTGSTSIIAGTTAGIDPIQSKYFLEEKKGSIVPRVAPGLNDNTYWLYKEAHNINHDWTIRAAGARQKYIDQSQSLNLFITQDYTFKDILDLYLKAWKNGIKTIYYIRSKSLEVEDCVSCSS